MSRLQRLAYRKQRKVIALIKSLKQSGVGVIFISHNLVDIFAVSDRIGRFAKGSEGRRTDFFLPIPARTRLCGSWVGGVNEVAAQFSHRTMALTPNAVTVIPRMSNVQDFPYDNAA